MADQEEMLVGLTGVKLKVSRIRQLLELHLMVRTSLHMETLGVSHTHMEWPVTACPLVVAAAAVLLVTVAMQLNPVPSARESAEPVGKELPTHGELEAP
jgi:hypothetical protein